MQPSNLLVIGLGLGTVFFGLIGLIFICLITSAFCKLFVKNKNNTQPVSNVSSEIPNKQEILAATCAVIAEELGTDAKNIKVTSFKRI